MKITSYREFNKNQIDNQVHLMTVNNDETGRNLIKTLRNQIRLSKTHQRIILYGRGNHSYSSKDGGHLYTVPIRYWEQIAVYVISSKKTLIKNP